MVSPNKTGNLIQKIPPIIERHIAYSCPFIHQLSLIIISNK